MQFTDQSFQKEVLESNVPVLVDFFAPWCGPCRAMGPIIEELEVEYKDKNIKIGKINIDENQEIAEKYGVMSIPTLILFNKGQISEKVVGMQDKNSLKALIEKNLS
jgi:thioredoxin 1